MSRREMSRFGQEKSPEQLASEEKISGLKEQQKLAQTEEERREIKKRIIAERQETLRKMEQRFYEVPDFEPDTRSRAVDFFRECVKDMNANRKAFRHAKDPAERREWKKQYEEANNKYNLWLNEDPKEIPMLEKAYFYWVRGRAKHIRFLALEGKLKKVEAQLATPAFSGETKQFSNEEMARLERLSQRQFSGVKIEARDEIERLNALYSEEARAGVPEEEITNLQVLMEAETDTKNKEKHTQNLAIKKGLAIQKKEYDALVAEIKQASRGQEESDVDIDLDEATLDELFTEEEKIGVPAGEIEKLKEEISKEENKSKRERLERKLVRKQEIVRKKEEYDTMVSGAGAEEDPKKLSKAELEKERARLEKKLNELWRDSQVEMHEGLTQLNKLLKDLNEGQAVLELPSVIHYLNQIAEWERLHRNTTIGGIFVGDPGTGKTTLFHHYLQEKGRGYVYLDLSEEVTRYMLFGSKSMEFKDPTEYYQTLTKQIAAMNDEEFAEFIKEQGKRMTDIYHVKRIRNKDEKEKNKEDKKDQDEEEERRAAFFQLLQEELKKAESLGPEQLDHLQKAKDRMLGTIGEGYRKELATKFKHLIQKNGWRDGVIIAALRRGDSVILDEFVKARDLTALYGLTTAKPGEDWYFEDNDERIHIPDHWHMYFTANIGHRFGGHRVAEALASRAQGKVEEIQYPPKGEELSVALAELCDSEGAFLKRSTHKADLIQQKRDIAQMNTLIGEIFPKIRHLQRTKEGSIPISWRTIRDIGEKLVETLMINGKKVRQRTDKSFGEAVYEVLSKSNKLFEDITMAKEVIDHCTACGLLLEDKLKDIVIKEGQLSEEEWKNRRAAAAGRTKDWEVIVEELQGKMAMARSFMGETRPVRKK